MRAPSRREFAAGALAAVLLGGSARAQVRLGVRTTPVPLSGDAPTQSSIGRLQWRGGFALQADDPRFGGWSDISIAPDGRTASLVSDRGAWAELSLEHGGAGTLTGVSGARLGPLIDLAGAPLAGSGGDAEGMAAMGDGGFAVSFEQRHRIWHYPPADPPFSRRPRVLRAPPGIEAAPRNGGMEALAQLSDGRLVAFAEELRDAQGHHAAWIGSAGAWRRTAYRAAPDHAPVGAVGLPGGDLLVLERAFGVLSGLRVRIVRVAAAALGGSAPLAGTELARLDHRNSIDNFEGIAARRGAAGETLIYLVSDDNFARWQRTLLVCFALSS